MAYQLAQAYVQIVPSMKGVGRAIETAFTGASRSAGDTAGRQAGTAFSSGLGDRLSSSLSGVVSSAGSMLAGIGKAGLAASGVAIGAIGKIGKSAMDAYATWEQAVGGVGTLFKNASKTVQQHAADAYRTAGVSANEYMTQVTSFAASLVSSLGGDTKAAAEAADTALRDMSDNANKMGTDLESLQWAYQGFAKQNYTMLDNLKLGYGGTKEEMQRLIEHANELGKAQGKTSDLTIDKFSDVVEAIHRVQQELDITGTTSDEAATTIEGSVGMMRAAWSNWLAEIGKGNGDIGRVTSELIESASTVVSLALPRAGQIARSALQGIGDAIGQLAPQLPAPFTAAVPYIERFAQALSDGSISLEDIARSATLAVGAFAGFTTIGGNAGGILSMFTGMGSSLDAIVGDVTSGLATLRGTVGAAGGVFGQLATRWGNALGLVDANLGGAFGLMANRARTGLGDMGSTLVGMFDSRVYVPLQQGIGGIGSRIAAPFQTLAGRVGGFLSPVTSAFSTAFQGFGAQLAGPIQAGLGQIGGLFASFFNPANFLKYFGIAALAGALLLALGALNESMGGQLGTMVNGFLTTQLPAYMLQFQTWVTTQLPILMQSGLQLLTGVLQGITANLPQMLTVAVAVLTSLVDGIASALPTLIPVAAQMITTIVQGVVDNLPRIIQSGLNLLTRFVEGVVNAIPTLVAALPRIITSFVSGITGMLPRIMTTGMNLLRRFVTGIVNTIPSLVAAIPQIISGFVNTVSSSLPQILSTGGRLLGEFVTGIINAIPKIVAAIPQVVGAVKDTIMETDWLSLGGNIIKGIVDGLKNAGGQILNALLNIVKDAWGGLLSWLGIHSPSRLMRDTVGRMIGLGLAVGIDDTGPDVATASTGLGHTALDALDRTVQQTPPPTVAYRTAGTWADHAPASDTTGTGETEALTRDDIIIAVTQALQTMPDMRLRLDTGVMAGELAPAIDHELARRTYRGLA